MDNNSQNKITSAAIDALRAALRGELLDTSHPGYDDARVVWNGMIDRRPALIARCRNAADVVASVNFARDHGLVLAVRSGGHNVAGYAVCESGLMIDLSPMNGVRLSPALDRAHVEGGAQWIDVDAATAPFNRATPGGLISSTGVAGLTLSGGIGWLRGRHGLACDNLVAADVVTADGHLLHASETEHPDLFWGLRGGGGNFGVVVNFEFKLHEIPSELMFCAPIYPEERANEIIPQWRDFMATAPEHLSGLAEFSTIPHDPAYPESTWGRRVLALAHVYDGPAAEGERVIAPLRALGDTLLDFSGPMPYRTIQTLYDAIFPSGRDRCYWKSTYLKGLDEKVVSDVAAHLSKRPSEMTYASIWKLGGAMQRVAPEATAFGDRSAPFMLSFDAIWSDAKDDDVNISWVRNAWTDLQRHSTGGLYLNFPGLGEDQSLVRNALGEGSYGRLQNVKRRYDPGNLFRLNQNILPA
jgi:FAD/FMN-containing dehydrogenase